MTDGERAIKDFLEQFKEVCIGNNPKRFYYKGGPADFLLQHGKYFEIGKLPEDIQLGEMKACFYNAATTAIIHGLRYVEGYTAAIIPVHHAWCIDKDNKVIEVTWKTPGSAYFGIEFNPMKVLNFKRKMAEPVLFNHLNFNLYENPYKPNLYEKTNKPRKKVA